MKCKVKVSFFDKENNERYRNVGEVFDASENRINVLSKKGLVEKVEDEKSAEKAGVANEKSAKK